MADLTGMMQAAAGSAGGAGEYIEDVFSTYLYTGNGSTQTITNGIDLDGEGGLVWIKQRDTAENHKLVDTVRGATLSLESNTTIANATETAGLTAFTSSGFSLGADAEFNFNTGTYASWTFRKAPKFFDVVTWTGTGVNRTVSHNLGSVPGCIIVKRTDTTGNWQVYHRANTANPETDYLVLNDTAATADSNTRWNDTAPTDAVFSLGTEATVNASGGTYVAYLWAHDDGGFGDDGEQNVISCGSFTTDGSGNATVSIGYEPQWVILKPTNAAVGWSILDTMRGWTAAADGAELRANTSSAENTPTNYGAPNATGFSIVNNALGSSNTVIYIAIRRGPMKTPTAGTEVFAMDVGDGSSVPAFTGGFPIDMALYRTPTGTDNNDIGSRLTGSNKCKTNLNDAEAADGDWDWDYQNGWYGVAQSSSFQSWMFQRAPGFFDVVCYTGTGANRTVTHNLGVEPEFIIIKARSHARNWICYHSGIGNTKEIVLNSNGVAGVNATAFNNTSPTSTVFTVGTDLSTNGSGYTFIAYLFATLAGVSKVGSYTGNGTSVSVTTGFQPRFILVKRTDSTGNWIYGDSVRGLVAGDDPFLLLNSDAAETTNEDWVDVSATGFTINETAANANVNTGTYIYLAIS